MEERDLFKLNGKIKKVLYKNEENGYVIAALEDNKKVCGNYFDTNIDSLVGEEVVFTGSWNEHKKYGAQFEFETIELKEAELFFFLTKIVKGIGESVARKLFFEFKEEELIDILNNRPNELLSVNGIKEKKLKTIVDSWKKFKHLRELGTFLAKYGVSLNFLSKIYAHFENVDNLKDKIKENPYMLINIKGIGFKRADEIGLSIGIDKKSEFRLQACMEYTLREYCDNNGNSSIDKLLLFRLLDENLGFEECDDLYEDIVTKMVAEQKLYFTNEQRLSPSQLYFCEKSILKFFNDRANSFMPKKIVTRIDEYITNKEKTLGFKLSDEQKEAVKLINDGHNTIFLIGYAGTGKSTSSRAILELLEEIVGYDEIMTCALSGIASQRISDTTGYKSATIQSLLVQHKEKDFFPYKVILLDEASMVNSLTFYQITSKIDEDTVFIVVGDDGQLPAIGAGNVLSDSIKHELAPIVKLTKIYRQNEKQAIAIIANEIRQGNVPEFRQNYEDFSFVDISINNYYAVKNTLNGKELSDIRGNNSNAILNEIIEIYATKVKKMNELLRKKEIAKFLTLFQIITPIKGGILGVENINKEIQKIFNKSKKECYKTKVYEYRLADKVIHIKNENMKVQTMSMYKEGSREFLEKRVFNGQLGIIIKLDFDEEKCIVLYPNDDMVVFYDFDVLESFLNLAYCLTIHKTQGMEYETALIPMTYSHYIMHNTKLLYTAITRAKKMCFIVGEEGAFTSACKRIETTLRQSVINDLLSSSSTL